MYLLLFVFGTVCAKWFFVSFVRDLCNYCDIFAVNGQMSSYILVVIIFYAALSLQIYLFFGNESKSDQKVKSVL